MSTDICPSFARRTLLLGMGIAKTFVEHTVYLVMMALLETYFHCNLLKNCSLINWQLQACEIYNYYNCQSSRSFTALYVVIITLCTEVVV